MDGRLILDWTGDGFEDQLPLFQHPGGRFIATDTLIFRNARLTFNCKTMLLSLLAKAKHLEFYDTMLFLHDNREERVSHVSVESIKYERVKEDTNFIQFLYKAANVSITDSKLFFSKAKEY